jgi:hypothetical protein
MIGIWIVLFADIPVTRAGFFKDTLSILIGVPRLWG